MAEEVIIGPDELRRRGKECVRLAASIPPGAGANHLAQMGRDYLEMADKLDAAALASESPEQGS
jgi:hypothetical protein